MTKSIFTFILLSISFPFFAQNNLTKEFVIASHYFDEERTVQVHLPNNFDKDEKLPVIFVFDAQWQPFFKLVTSSIDYLTEIKELPKSIVVGIHSENRQFELTPAPVNEDWQMPSLGGAKKLEKNLLEEVIPLIDSVYQTLPFRTAIGHSLGGTFVLNSLIDNPTLFNAVIAISPNLQIDYEEIVLKMARNITNLKKRNKFIFTTMGTDGEPDASFLPPLKKLDSIMTAEHSKTCHWHFNIYKGFNHATTPLESINNALLVFSKKWKISDDQKNTILKNGDIVADFKQFYKDLSDWAGYSISPDKNDYYNYIRFIENNEAYDHAIRFYKSAIENFPNESRLYNGMAENMMIAGSKKDAEINLNKALKILETETFDYPADKAYFKKLYMGNLEMLKEK